MKLSVRIVGIVVLASTFFIACKNDLEIAQSTVRVFLVDAPGDYEAVYVDVRDVRIHDLSDTNTSDSSSAWRSLEEFTPAVYNLLDLINGNEAFLGEIAIDDDKRLGEIRLVLGDSNSVVVDSVIHPLTIPSGSESGLKIKINENLEGPQTYNLILDFDAARSVKQNGNGDYMLRPVIKAHLEASSGSIAGVIAPADVPAVVYAIEGNDSNATYANSAGNFMFSSLEPGTYTVTAVSDSSGLNSPSESNVTVMAGETTTLSDTLRFQ